MKKFLFALLCSSILGSAFADQPVTSTNEAPKVIMVKPSTTATAKPHTNKSSVKKSATKKVTKKSKKSTHNVKAKKSTHSSSAKHKAKNKKSTHSQKH